MSIPAAPQLPLPPLAGLVEMLRGNGFMVTTDDYVHLLKIVEEYGNEPPHSLALHICPIIAITDEEQRRFYHVFGAYMQRQGTLGSAVRRIKRWKQWALLLLAIVASITVNMLALPQLVDLAERFNQETILRPGEPFADDVVGLGIMLGRERDTVPLQAQWVDSGRGVIGSGARVSHVLQDSGLHVIRRTITDGPRGVRGKVMRLVVYVCVADVTMRIASPEHVVTGRVFSLRAEPISGAALIRSYKWDTSEIAGAGKVLRRDSASITLRIDTPGIYTVRCAPVALSASARCITPAYTDLSVADTGKQYELSFTGGGKPFVPQKSLIKGPWYLLLPLLGVIGYWGFRKRGPKAAPLNQTREKEPQVSAVPLDAPLKPPYEVPFPPPAPSAVIMDKPLRRFLQLLRFKAEEEEQEPDVRRSIRATIRSGGMAQMVFRPRRRTQEYLLFIDSSRPDGLMHALYKHLASLMEAEGIPVTVFYYDVDFNCSTGPPAAKLRLRRIADDFPAAIPIILGDGAALMHPFGGTVRTDLLEQCRRWDAALLITPIARAEWGGRERELIKYFMIAPADAAELGRLGQDFKAGRKTRHEAAAEFAESADYKSVAGLRAYLGDEVLFQWLCAQCIYPKPRWELLVAFGKAICSWEGREQDLRYDNLLRFCRIPWLAEGTFPQRLRMELLKALTVEAEVAARAALVSLLQGVRTRYAGDYIFSTERQLQETLSRFVLYGHDPQRFAAHGSSVETFKELLRNGEVTDAPAWKYLEGAANGRRDWRTPLTLPPAAFIEADVERRQAEDAAMKRKASADRWKRRGVATASMLALVAGWLLLNFSEEARGISALRPLYTTDSSQLVALSYRVQRDFLACGDSVKSFSALPATLNAGGKPYGMPFDRATQTVSTLAPLQALGNVPFSLALGINGKSEPLTYQFDKIEPGGSISIRCSNAARDDGLAETGATGVLPAYLNEIWAGKTNNRLLNLNLNTGMIYYSTGGTDTWGTSRIENVLRTSDSGYRIVVNVYPGYMVFFLKGVGRAGFRMAFCQQRYNARADALNAPEDCGAYDDMRLYYAQDDRKIFLPTVFIAGDRQIPVGPQLEKLRRLVDDGMMDAPGPLIVSYTQQDNGNFLTRGMVDNVAVREFIGNSIVNVAALTRQSGVVLEKKTPFQRAYLTLNISYGKYPQGKKPPTSSVTPNIISPDSQKNRSDYNRRLDSIKSIQETRNRITPGDTTKKIIKSKRNPPCPPYCPD